MSSFGTRVFYTWLSVTPHGDPGSNQVQDLSSTRARVEAGPISD